MKRAVVLLVLLTASSQGWFAASAGQPTADGTNQTRRPLGRIRLVGHSLADENGPFLGLGVSYFPALWRCKYDRPRLRSDLSFLAGQGFNYFRMLSMVGYHPAWEGMEIAPVTFTNRAGKRVEGWSDYWQQLGSLIDLAYDEHGLRTQITIFADAQLMPEKEARLAHLNNLLERVVRGREQKIMLLEVANEGWQNGFPGEQGISDLREFAAYLNARTEVPVAITSNHDIDRGFEKTYAGSDADLATWHFSRDRSVHEGWRPVYEVWDYGDRPGFPPVISNEPIGPGSSVASERAPIRLVMAAAFAYVAKLPAYVFHGEAGVRGKTRFEDTVGIECYRELLQLMPPDLPNWKRFEGKEQEAPLKVFAGEQPDKYWPDVENAPDGCLRSAGTRKGDDFICVPIGIRAGGLELEARSPLRLTAYDPLTGATVKSTTLKAGERVKLPAGPGALLLKGSLDAGRD